MKKSFALSALLLASLVSCSNSEQNQNQNQTNNRNQGGGGGGTSSAKSPVPTSADFLSLAVTDPLDESEFFSDRDHRTTLDSDSPVTISFQGNDITASGEGVTIQGNQVVISQEGTYILTGNLTDGQVWVEMTDETHKAQLVLDNVNLVCTTGAPIHVETADKVFITTLAGTQNNLTAAIPNDTDSDAGILSRADLTLNGEGTLHVQVANGDGIVGKDELTITSGTYTLQTTGHGLDANDSIAIAGGNFAITAGKDGIHCAHSSNESKGNIFISGGEFSMVVDQDGIDAGGFLEIQDGIFDITTNGGWESAPVKQAISNNKGGTTTSAVEDDGTPSTKGVKSVGLMRLFGGVFVLDCYDDAIHSDTRLEIHQGEYSISTADDGIHANWETLITGGTIDIHTSFEGIEGQRIEISGGDVSMYCGDDGINAASTSPDPDNDHGFLIISGGNITLDSNSEGDGVDSNGSILMTGGNVLISSTVDNRDTALDSDGDSVITGGIFLATGSNSGTVQNFSASSTQGSILLVTASTQTGEVILRDSNKEILAQFSPVKQYQAVTISIPQLEVGEKYSLDIDGETVDFTMDSLQFSSGNSSNSRR